MILDKSDNFKQYVLNHKGSKTLVVITCPQCNKEFSIPKNNILSKLSRGQSTKACSKECQAKLSITTIAKPCSQCGELVYRVLSQSKKSKNNNVFCNSNCAATYCNTHKTTGTRRSKLEIWLETELPKLYPDLNFMFNDKTIINSELDIYLPDFKLAFELNGIFHYEPIFGNDKLNQIQNNDANKFQKCQAAGISLCIIDSSWIKYNKESNFQKILDIITKIVNDIK